MNKWEKETIKALIVIVSFILLITTIFFCVKTYEEMYYNNDSLLNQVLGKKWYNLKENYSYETLTFKEDKTINYLYHDLNNNEGVFDKCNNIVYSSKNDMFKLKCDDETKKVKIEFLNNEKLILDVDNNKYTYYSKQSFDE